MRPLRRRSCASEHPGASVRPRNGLSPEQAACARNVAQARVAPTRSTSRAARTWRTDMSRATGARIARPCARERTDMAVLDIRDVSKAFATTRAVESFDLTVGDGELVCLLGPSGSGKSTLLRMIGGFETPTSGVITIDGEDVTRVAAREAPDRHGLPEPRALDPHERLQEPRLRPEAPPPARATRSRAASRPRSSRSASRATASG